MRKRNSHAASTRMATKTSKALKSADMVFIHKMSNDGSDNLALKCQDGAVHVQKELIAMVSPRLAKAIQESSNSSLALPCLQVRRPTDGVSGCMLGLLTL